MINMGQGGSRNNYSNALGTQNNLIANTVYGNLVASGTV
jgi:hypothetical protein